MLDVAVRGGFLKSGRWSIDLREEEMPITGEGGAINSKGPNR